MERLVAFFDEHYPHTIKPYFDPRDPKKLTAVDKFLLDFKPTVLVKGGDSLDLSCISHWNKGKIQLLEGKRLRKDYDGYNILLDKQEKMLGKHLKKRAFLTGNHEVWVDRLVEEDPQSRDGFIDLDSSLHLTDRGYTITPHRQLYRCGKLFFHHGNYKDGYCAAYHAKAMSNLYHRNIVYGHFHTEQTFMEISPVDQHPTCAKSVGTMGNVNPEWQRNNPNGWVNSFYVAYIGDDGNFTDYVVRIVNGRFIFDGVEYK